jgi:rRNA maturation RNase YbeY
MLTQRNRPDPENEGDAPVVASADNYWIVVQIDPAYESALDADHLHALATFVLTSEQHPEPLEVGITVTTDAEIHHLNKTYLGHDYPTDVLSFSGETARAGGRLPLPGPEDAEGAEQDTVAEMEYVTEGYEGEMEDGATQPSDTGSDADDDAEGSESDTTAAGAVQFVTPPGWPRYLGDVVISYDTAASQAADYGHVPAAEVDVLLVHGLLHLLGYNDLDDVNRAHMHTRQDEIVAAFAADYRS